MIPSPVQRVRERLGSDVVLLAIAPRKKNPTLSEWQKVRRESMDDPAYLDTLNHGGNIGVSLGEPSGGLCTVDLDGATQVDTFLALNTTLRGTLRTTRVRGCNFWLRIRGTFPASGKIKDGDGQDLGEWRANGNQTVIHGAAMDASKGETEPTAYRILVDAPPLEISFDEIQWPPEWRPPWEPEPEDPALTADRQIIEEHGEPFSRSKQGKITLNPMYFVARFARPGDTLFEPSQGCFYCYDAARGVWTRRTEAAIKIELAEESKNYADAQAPGDRQQIINARTPAALAGMVSLLQGIVEETDAFPRTHGIVHVQNGMLHLKGETPELRPFAAEYRSRNVAPVAYDSVADCPRFRRELLEPALDAADVSLVQRYAGACLLGRNVAQKILVLTGTAGGGKSTWLEILERVLGIENVAEIRTEHLQERFEITRFRNKLLLTGKDVKGRFLEEEGASKLKALVGHDLLSPEQKGTHADVQIRGDFSVVITCNSRLRVKLDGDADAWRRRLLIVRYERPKPERPNRDFASQLLAEEGPGILRWMVDGARAHLAELNRCGDYELTARQQQRVNALLAESDSVREFIRQRVEVCAGTDVTVYELIEAYSAFCDSMGWEPLTARRVENTLADAMQELRRVAKRNGIERDGSAKRGFTGVRLIEAGEAATV